MSDNIPTALQKLPGSKVLGDMNKDGLFGKNAYDILNEMGKPTIK